MLAHNHMSYMIPILDITSQVYFDISTPQVMWDRFTHSQAEVALKL